MVGQIVLAVIPPSNVIRDIKSLFYGLDYATGNAMRHLLWAAGRSSFELIARFESVSKTLSRSHAPADESNSRLFIINFKNPYPEAIDLTPVLDHHSSDGNIFYTSCVSRRMVQTPPLPPMTLSTMTFSLSLNLRRIPAHLERCDERRRGKTGTWDH